MQISNLIETRPDVTACRELVVRMEEPSKRDPTHQFERCAIGGLASYFLSLGLSLTELGHPEDDPENPINVDAIFQIESKLWAIEHSRIVHDSKGPAAKQAAENYLRPKLCKLAKIHKVQLHASLYPPRWTGKQKPKHEWGTIVELAKKAIKLKEWSMDERGNSVIATPGTPSVTFNFFPSDNPLLEIQYKKALRDPLISKLSGQLKLAKDNGYSVLLLLDKKIEDSVDADFMWMPDTSTLDNVVKQIIEERPGIVDEVWLREASGTYRRLIGNTFELNIPGNT